MKIERLDSVERVPLAVDYRRMYRGQLYVSVGAQTIGPTDIEFVLELSPFGTQEVQVNFLDATDYPVVPAIRLLKDHIGNLDKDGQLERRR